jgi:UDP-glucose 4-epimerase
MNEQPSGQVSDVSLFGAFDTYRGRNCVVSGGLGFIGSNLVRVLVALGARVTVIDNLSPGQGGNAFNLQGVEGVDVRMHDIADEDADAEALKGQEFVFNIAGKSSHLNVLESPFVDMETNVRGQLVLLEAIRKHAPDARVVYASTRSIYGAIQTSPVGETHPFLPTEVNSADKAAADLYHTAYWYSHELSTVNLRLSNIYGPRMLIAHSRQGFINWFVRLAVEGGTFKLYGDGDQKRDMVYVEDTVEAFLRAGLASGVEGAAFNIGSGAGVSLREIAETLVEITGKGRIEYVPFPQEARRIEIGDYIADTRRSRELLGWQVRTPLYEGLRASCEYYTRYPAEYLKDM